MRIAIHKYNIGFSTRWINYCKKRNIEYKIVNPYRFDIVEQISDCDIFLWDYHQSKFSDVLFAKQLLYSLQISGKKVFPDFLTCWHFDDKVGQKYLLEAIGAPIVPTYIFYSKNDAIEWVNKATFPIVFKLRGGAGSSNVRMVRTRKDALRLTTKAFNNGFPQFDALSNLKERIRKFKDGKDSLFGILKGIGRLAITTEYNRNQSRERGYIYFQEFIPNNKFDIRVIVTGNRAFAIKRLVRNNDFRASGSGRIIYEKSSIDERCIQIAFEVNKELKSQSIAFDFVFDNNKHPLIVEISYAYSAKSYDPCPGYWDSDLIWHEGNFNPQDWIMDDLINSSLSLC